MPAEGRTTFRRLTADLVEPLEKIVCFLALLELCKRGAIDLAQAGRLGELQVLWVGLPDDDDGGGEIRLDEASALERRQPVFAGADLAGVDEYEG